jgi:shikimate dehydrogenase
MKLGLLGHHIQYSFSPIIFQTLSKRLNLDIKYTLYDIEEYEIAALILKLKSSEIHGLNVTKPYKEVIIKYCDELSDEARQIGSVNVLSYVDGKIIGHNTDSYGFLASLAFHNIELNDHTVCILGNGGSAKTVYESLKYQVNELNVFKRKDSNRPKIAQIEYDYQSDKIQDCTLLIQTTTIGLSEEDTLLVSETIVNKSIVVDLIYHRNTVMMQKAKQSYGGLMMLIFQALKAYEIWTQQTLKEDVVHTLKEVLENELNRNTI